MSNLVRFATPRKSSRSNLLIGWLSGGSLTLYSGTPTESADDALSDQVELVAFGPLPDPAGTTTDGVFVLASGTDPALVSTTGTPDFARGRDSTGATVGDFDVGAPGSGAAIILDNLNLVAGALVSLVSFAIAEQ